MRRLLVLWFIIGYLCFFQQEVVTASSTTTTVVSLTTTTSTKSIIKNGKARLLQQKRIFSKNNHYRLSSLSIRGGSSTTTNNNKKNVPRRTASAASTNNNILQFAMGIMGGYVSYQFAQQFPFLLTPKAAKMTYIKANYNYEKTQGHAFCTSAWTYMTDYMVLIALLLVGSRIFLLSSIPTNNNDPTKHHEQEFHQNFRFRSLLLLGMYSIQFLGGGLAHQFINNTSTKIYRVLWTIVVGAVAVSGGIIGSLATTTVSSLTLKPTNNDQNSDSPSTRKFSWQFLHHPSDTFWWGYSILLAVLTGMGRLSYQRPAVDTFVAGTSQALPTFYFMGVVVHKWMMNNRNTKSIATSNVSKLLPIVSAETCCGVLLGFGLNSILLPAYALVVQYTNISTAMLNVFLHSWLCMCYTIQGLVLYQLLIH